MDAVLRDQEPLPGDLAAETERTLLAHRGRFLAWMERRTLSRALAEDILQTAYARAFERGVPLMGEESVVAWFKAVLRNAWLDVMRRAGVEADASRRLASEAAGEGSDEELASAVCACVQDVIVGLKPEYAQLLREVDLRARSVGEVAREAGITSNNAGVRLLRARRALGRQLGRLCGACAAHGCLDCHCKGA